MRSSLVLVVIPAWNEAGRIGAVLQAIPPEFPILVIDDGSSDSTAQVAAELGAEVIRHETNQGKGVALMTAFAWALEKQYSAVLTLDADGQHDPAELHKFLGAFTAGEGDLIIGRRSTRAMPFPRNLANAFSSWLLSRVLRTAIHDNQSGYRLYSRELIGQLEIRRAGFEFEVDVIMQALQLGFKLGWVEIRTIYADEISSHFHPVRDTWKFFSLVWFAYRTRDAELQRDVD